MKNNVNLYHVSCRPKKLKFSFVQLIMLFVACLLLVAIINVAVVQRDNSMMAKKEKVTKTIAAMQSELSALVVKLQANRAPNEKVLEKQQLIAEVATKQRLLNNLNNVDLGLVVSFSELMLGLSHADIDQVSISTFSINNGKLNIQGKAMYSDSVPLWLTHVQATAELKDVSFTGVNITEQDNLFLFQLSHVALNKKVEGKK